MRISPTGCDVLILSELPLWPLDQGSKVHGCGMARGLLELGMRVRMSSVRSTPIADAPAWLSDMLLQWPRAARDDVAAFGRGWAGPGEQLRRRIASHQGVDPAALAGALPLVRSVRPSAVVALGQHGLMVLHGLREAFPDLPTIWYAADDPVLFQLSCLRREGIAGAKRARMLAVYTLMERLFGGGVDGVIGVNPADTAALARLTGIPHAATIPNGVDIDYFTPSAVDADAPLPVRQPTRNGDDSADECSPAIRDAKSAVPREIRPFFTLARHADGGEGSHDGSHSPSVADVALQWPDRSARSIVFWGRMDFEPNADAVCWFAERVWPALRARFDDATWAIVGKHPAAEVRRLHGLRGVTVTGEAADVRPFARAAAAVVLPMRCGGGIKNKLLEAAAMGRPIVASARALRGIELPAGLPPPMAVCERPQAWVEAIERMWIDRDHAFELGRRAREWVGAHHTWPKAAERLRALIGAIGRELGSAPSAIEHARAA